MMAKARGRPRKPEDGSQQVFVRMPQDLVQRLDAYVTTLARERPGFRATRADAIRTLLYRALDEVEAEPQP
jgi:hypothetical protein